MPWLDSVVLGVVYVICTVASGQRLFGTGAMGYLDAGDVPPRVNIMLEA
jgi:hypothetical protein